MTSSPALSSDVVGREFGPISQAIDARWLMAYAAGLGETDSRYFDTRRQEGPAAHPVFPVCFEWPLALRIHERIASTELQERSVHAAHDLAIHRPPRAGETVFTTARVVTAVRRPPGALLVVRYQTVDHEGAPVTTTRYASIYRDAAVAGPDREEIPWAADGRPPAEPVPLVTIPVGPTLAHVYTECARIWNPIHTDIAVAERAGLPGIILHGTATLALTVSRVLAGRDPTRVRRVTCRFTGMVRMPSTLTVRALPAAGPDSPAYFDVLGADGRPVLSRGALYVAGT